jgi:hypothetical protein
MWGGSGPAGRGVPGRPPVGELLQQSPTPPAGNPAVDRPGRPDRPDDQPRAFTRLALGFSKKRDNRIATTTQFVARSNYCRRHSTVGGTPAMAAGLSRHRWSMAELLRAAGM